MTALDRLDLVMSHFRPSAAGSATRTGAAKLADEVSIKDFPGVVGDGVHDDTAGIQAALASGKALFVPDGRFRTTAKLTATVANLRGVAPGRAVFVGDNCDFLEITAPTGVSTFATSTICDLTISSTVDGTRTGIKLTGAPSGFGKHGCIRNVCFDGVTADKTWQNPILLNNGSGVEITGCFFLGRHDSNANYRHMSPAIKLTNASTDVRITNNWFYFADVAILLDGGTSGAGTNAGEGVNIAKNHMVLVQYGVWSRYNRGNMLDIEGNHIAAMERGIVLGTDGIDGSNHSFIHHNFIMKRADSTYGYVGIEVYGTRCKIDHNELSVEGNFTGGSETQIVVGSNTAGRGTHCVISGNDVWDADQTGIWIRPSAVKTSVYGNTGDNNATNLLVEAGDCIIGPNFKPAYRGALIHKAGNTAVGSSYAAITFDNVINNTDNFWNGSSKFVIPAGIKRVEVSAGVFFSGSGGSYQHEVIIRKNGATFFGAAAAKAAGDGPYLQATTGVIDVATGDEFQVVAMAGTPSAVNATAFSWFQIKVVEWNRI